MRVPTHAGLAGVSALYVGLLWVACSIARGKGLLLFGAGLVVLAWALSKARVGQRLFLYRAFLCVLLAASGVAGLELGLILFPGVLSGRLANFTFAGYHRERDGIYRPHPALGHAMRPSFRRAMYWNGHWWTHETNADGYRGPRLPQADAVFLGDSMVYGHGVEEDQAVPAQVSRRGGLRVANLGQPGTGAIQALVLYREKGARLGPRRVFICLHHNDAQDSLDVFEPPGLLAFLQRPQDPPLARLDLRAPPAPNLFERWAQHAALPLGGARLISALRGKPDWVLEAPAPLAGDGKRPFVPQRDVIDAPYPPLLENAPSGLRLAWQANRQALAELQRLAVASSAELVVFDLGYPRAFTEAVEAMSVELGARYSDAGRVALARALAGEPIYLANDGHWSARGSEVIAAELLQRGPAAAASSR